MNLLWRLTMQGRARANQVLTGSELSHPGFGALVSRTPECRGQLAEIVSAVNAAGGAYHQLDFGSSLVIQGDYDMNKYVQFYHLPSSLEGQTVLDIGTAAGYFALECARQRIFVVYARAFMSLIRGLVSSIS